MERHTVQNKGKTIVIIPFQVRKIPNTRSYANSVFDGHIKSTISKRYSKIYG
ncbi:MAG TPA: hypothetical protein VER14_07950 [Phototrophicaceae bacterium]|nr:hypothetical protein [Phototrophicaceae bacterium]